MKKKIYLLFTLLVLLIPTIKANAVVMWMQCTDSEDDKMECVDESTLDDCSSYEYYNTFAIINDERTSSVRHIAYNPNDIFSDKGPTFVLYNGEDDGGKKDDICWYKDKFSGITECESKTDLIAESELYKGMCPVGVGRNTAHWYWKPVLKDFLVLYGGPESAKESSALANPFFVVYSFTMNVPEDAFWIYGEDMEEYYMIEGYNSAGIHTYATNVTDQEKFEALINVLYFKLFNPGCDEDVISETCYNTDYLGLTGAIQIYKIAELGNKYFDLLNDRESWMLINSKVDSDDNIFDANRAPLITSEADNPGLVNFINDWYSKNSVTLIEQQTIDNKFKPNGDYYKLITTAEEISDALDNNKEYKFSDNYPVEKVVDDLSNAYNDLKTLLLDGGEYKYTSKDENCNDYSTEDYVGSLTGQFFCDYLDTLYPTKVYGDHQGLLQNIVTDVLTKQLTDTYDVAKDISDISSRAEEHAISLAKAIAYIKKNTTAMRDEVLSLFENYSELVENFGYQLVFDCESLIGEDLQDRIEGYTNIIKIAIPIILIGLGIVDFTKAVFAGDDDKMSKAQKDFLKRLGIAILIFLIPTIVKIILGLANKVWTFIVPDSCGILETKSSEESFPEIKKNCYYCESSGITMWFTPLEKSKDKNCEGNWSLLAENDPRCGSRTE